MIFSNNWQDEDFINKFTQGMDAGTMPQWAQGKENFKDYILGTYDNTPKTPEWASAICGVKAEDIKKLAEMYASTKPAALKASWAPGRNAYGEQYNRMAAALQAMTGNIGVLGGCAEGIGKGWHPESVAYPYDPVRQHLVLFHQVGPLGPCGDQLSQPEARGAGPVAARRRHGRDDPQHPWHLLARFGLAEPAHQHQQGNRGDPQARLLARASLLVCMDSTITPAASGRLSAVHALRAA
ncbi:MAG: molybdopterin-dependent oxidoreductase [Hyphomicrobiales bacterium]